MNLTFHFNPDVNYLEGVLHEDLINLFEHPNIRYQNDNVAVVQVEDIDIYLHDSGMITIKYEFAKNVISATEKALKMYLKLHEFDRRFKFPYTFKLQIQKNHVGAVIHTFEEVEIQYETRELTDCIMFTIYQKAKLY